MKRTLLYILLSLPLGLCAQNMYDAASFLGNDLSGTARYIGMAGSMSALGADLSTMSTNPAGIALYRSNDLSFTGGLNIKNNSATYEGTTVQSSNINGFVSNVSSVFSMDLGRENAKFLNLAFGYRKKNNLDANFEMYGDAGIFSQQYIIDLIYKENPFDFNNMSGDMYQGFGYSWLSLLAADGYLHDGENFITDAEGNLLWAPKDISFYQEERGGVDVMDFNASLNLADRGYIGLTLGISNVDYGRACWYSDVDADGKNIYTMETSRYIKGTGFDLKLGAIVRPFKYSPFKLGFSVHTPTWYQLTEYFSAAVDDGRGSYVSTLNSGFYEGDFTVSSSLATPWRFNASMAYTFGTYVALDAEYEYANYAQSKFYSRSAVCTAQNEEMRRNLKEEHTVRAGAEFNYKGFALRAGYNYSTAPFEADAYKNLGNASVVETSTDYINRFDKHVATLGMGYRGRAVYFDLAYMMDTQKADFFPFYDTEYINPAAGVDFTNHNVVATLGFKF